MYDFLNKISQFFSEPILQLTNSSMAVPVIGAFLLGILGSFAPCQITGNFTSIAYFGNKAVGKHIPWVEISLFILGKLMVYSVIGILIWLLGREFQSTLTTYFAYFRKSIGFLNIIVGLFLLGYLKLIWVSRFFTWRGFQHSEGKLGALLLGISYSVAFCPTMFVLFFVQLMPLVLSTTYGFALTPIFGIGTALPLLIILLLIWSFGAEGSLIKKGKKFGHTVQKCAGVVIIIIGLLDIVTYW
ncbi:sulfite exporter TauE/SafE family protein [Peribacillus frigoritolerans]|uniref:urease accessory protein UreH domain-containing protein n=1 Tax=Peribacillus frigoritolerans TaxID=450367 RepID=UPI00207AF99E|nr:sulfite exporter TauE/SafE family protein [Peribacillus frigoritolerans]USK67043.1 sulfite exporter TauE/SafE family protein [Peribacillus frigoritolerans]